MAVIRKAAVSDAENILEYCKAVGAENDNLTFGAEGISLTVEKEREYLKSFTDSDKQFTLWRKKTTRSSVRRSFRDFPKPDFRTEQK